MQGILTISLFSCKLRIIRCLSNYITFKNEVLHLAALNNSFKALSDPTRRKILQLLRLKEMSAGEIADQFNISKPSISHHLNILKQADLVSDERQGQNIIYSLNTTVFDNIINWFFTLTNNPKKEVFRDE